MVNKNKRYLILGIAIAVILIVGIIIIVSVNKHNDDWKLLIPDDDAIVTTPHQNMEYVLTSDASWANLAWLGNLDPSKVISLNFVNKSKEFNATQAWIFDGLSCYYSDKDGAVYILVGEKIKITGSMNGAFSNLKNMKSIKGLEFVDTSEVQDMTGLFKGCDSLIEIPIKDIEMNGIDSTESMFQGCLSLVNLDMSEVDLSHVINMDNMFAQCKSLEELHLPKTKNVKSMSGLLEDVGRTSSYGTNVIGELSTAYCENMSYMFSKSTLFSYAMAQNFNTGNLRNAEGMFYNCAIDGEIDLSKWTTHNLETTKDMFWRNMSIKKCNINGWNIGSLNDCSGMFYACTSLTKVDLGWTNTQDVIYSANGMFKNCFHIKEIDVSCFDGVYFGDAREMFNYCENLSTIYSSGFCADISDCMFEGCFELSGAMKYSEQNTDIKMATTDGYFTKK